MNKISVIKRQCIKIMHFITNPLSHACTRERHTGPFLELFEKQNSDNENLYISRKQREFAIDFDLKFFIS